MSTQATLDRTGSFAAGDGWIETASGQQFNVVDPLPETIRIEDIAHSLSMQCRFNGHCKQFYSVAEHCCHVHDELLSRWGMAPITLAGLLHDASEAYLSDVVRPVKPLLTNYGDLENKLQTAIFYRFGIPPRVALRPEIKHADNALCMAECQQLMHSGGKEWDWGNMTPADIKLPCWPPGEAEIAFLSRYAKYVKFADWATEVLA